MVAQTRKKRSRSLSAAGLFLLIFLPLALFGGRVARGAYLQERANG